MNRYMVLVQWIDHYDGRVKHKLLMDANNIGELSLTMIMNEAMNVSPRYSKSNVNQFRILNIKDVTGYHESILPYLRI